MGSKFMHGSPILIGDNTIPGVQLFKELREYVPTILQKCRDWGLDFYPTVVQLLTYDEISEIAAYGGFPVRYPHWQFGMEYEELQRGYEFGMHKIYEMVINANPCYIYCLNSNTLVDHLTVVAHATGHNDFFKNNIHFSATDTSMLNKMANHGTRIRRYMSRWGKERVIEFIDHVLRIETLIDGSKAWHQKVVRDRNIVDQRKYRHPRRLKVEQNRLYMEPFLNTKEFRRQENERIAKKDVADEIGLFSEPTKDIMGFIRENAPLKPWQADIVSMLYEESLYFFPQRQTKVMNEGWACAVASSLVSTTYGFVTLKDIVDRRYSGFVNDGNQTQRITNWFKHENMKTVKLVTRRGYEIEGSVTHRLMDADYVWKSLSEWKVGSRITLSHGADLWPQSFVEVGWKPKKATKTLLEISTDHKIDRKEVWRMRKTSDYSTCSKELKEDILLYDSEICVGGNRKSVAIPDVVDERLGTVFGYMCGDGHITEHGNAFGLTSGDEEQIDNYIGLVKLLFDLDSSKKWDESSLNGRWRAATYSKHVEDFFVHHGFEKGFCARRKKIPDVVLQSPKSVMSAFLRAYFDCDAYAGKEGIILSTSSPEMVKQVQVVLLNYGILSNKLEKEKDNYHVMITGLSAKRFYEEIGFGLPRKQESLRKCVIEDRSFFMQEDWTDEVISLEDGVEDVYDITVENTHRYVAQGFINHNSLTDHVIMARQGYVSLGQKSHDMGIVEYADHKMGVLGGKYSMNPYKLGFYLMLDIEERWDKGQFGTEWDECTNMRLKEKWDTKAMLGKEKLFEVRKYYDDLTFINEFFTEDFCRQQEYFFWKHFPNGEYRLEHRDYKKIKEGLMRRHLNGGLPDIRLTEPNYRGKGYLMLQHEWDGRSIFDPYVRDVLASLRFLWNNDVYLASKSPDGSEVVYGCYGNSADQDVEVTNVKEHIKHW